MKNISVAVIILSFLSGCESTPQTVMPTYRLNSPEVSSVPLAVNISSGVGSISEVNLTESDKVSSENVNDSALFFRASIVAVEGLKIIASGAANHDEVASVTALYQFYGLNADKTVAGNVSQALSLAYVSSSGRGSYGSLTPQVTAEDKSVNWEQDTDIIDVAWILGYRISPELLTYGGPFYQWGKAKVRNALESGSNKLESYSKEEHNGNLLGANLALEYRFNFGLGLTGEVVFSKAKWSDSTITESSFNFKIDYQF